MAKICATCRKEMGMFTGKVLLKDREYVCNSCWEKAGFNTWGDLVDKPYMYTSKDILEMIKGTYVHDASDHDYNIKNFVVTSDICPAAKFNDDTKQMILANHIFVYGTQDPQRKLAEYYTMFSYDQIVSFELLENGQSVASGGVGRAALGGVLFGGVGAIVGASTRSYKSVCNELKIKITVKNYKDPAFYIPLIYLETNKSSSEYKAKMTVAQNILSKLQLITSTDTHDKPVTTDKFEEIKKYKNLLDEGIISQEEFENKKKELLNLYDTYSDGEHMKKTIRFCPHCGAQLPAQSVFCGYCGHKLD